MDPFLRVERHTVRLPDGRVVRDWAWVVTPDYASILAVTPDGRFPCFRQFKYAAGGETLAPAGGYLDPGEEPLAAARRELREELGLDAAAWVPLGGYPVDSNRGAGHAHLFLALDARPAAARPASDDLEEQEVLHLSRGEMEQALRDGAFRCLAWAALVALGLAALDRIRGGRTCAGGPAA